MCNAWFCLFVYLFSKFSFFPRMTLVSATSNKNLREVTNKAMKLIKSAFFRYKDQENHKRMYLAAIALQAIQLSLKKYHNFAQEIIHRLRMYFTGTRDAFLSHFEMRSVLYVCFKLSNKLDLFDICCQEFDKLMPECPVKIEPRSLSHLARCRIRQSLRVSHLPLPSAVDSLFLPKILKNFLLGGDEFDITSKNGNSSSHKTVTQSDLASLFSERSTSWMHFSKP